ncbi:MAG: SprT family zinc-dependent metalloprotease [Oscillospiraceae bacterium]
MEVSGIEIEVLKKNIKNMHLYVMQPYGKVRITAPLRISDDKIRLFVTSKISWITKQQRKFDGQEQQPQRQYISGETIYLWGKQYKLIVMYSNKFNHISVTENEFVLTVRKESTVKQRNNVINDFYRAELKKSIPPMLINLQPKMGVVAKEFRIKNMTTRWGTCNTNEKRIWLSLQLAKRPVECLEYVVIHELTHLLEKPHSKKFYAYMDKFSPNWKATKKGLNGFIWDYLET